MPPGWLLEHADPRQGLIVPRGKAALGYSQSLPRDVSLHTENQLSDTMVMAATALPPGKSSSTSPSGAQNDLERVTKMAHNAGDRLRLLGGGGAPDCMLMSRLSRE